MSHASGATKHDELRAALGLNQLTLGPVVYKNAPDFDHDIGLSPDDADFRGAMPAITEVETLVAARKLPTAVAKIQELNLRQPYVIVPVDDQKYMPVWRYAKLRLQSLGAPAINTYCELYEKAAAKELEAAQDSRSKEGLNLVVRHYPVTQAAGRALQLLSAIEMEQGRAAIAAHYALEAAGISDLQPARIASLAAALYASGDRASLSRLASALEKHFKDDAFEAEGRQNNLTEYVRGLQAKLPPAPAAPDAIVPGILVWENETRVAAQRDAFRRGNDRQKTSKYAPVLRDKNLYLRTEESLEVYDKLSGELLWQEKTPSAITFSYFSSVCTPTVTETEVFLHHSVYIARQNGRLAGRLNAITKLNDVTRSTRWSVTTEEPDNTQLEVHFVSEPAIGDGVVTVTAENGRRGGNKYLRGYRADSGAFLWSTMIASVWTGQQNNVQSCNIAPPAIAGGFAICCPERGVVTAVNLATGEVWWVTKYESSKEIINVQLSTPRGVLEEGAQTTPPLVDGTTAYVLPADSHFIYAIDINSGKIIWMRSRTINGVTTGYYLVAAANGRLYVSGSALECIDGANGKTIWLSEVFETPPAGRPVAAKGKILCPIESGIAYIDTETGKLTESFIWKDWLRDFPQFGPQASGNMLIADGRLVIADNNSLSVFESADVEKDLLVKLKEDPNNPILILRLGLVQIQLARIDESIATTLKAVALAGGEPTGEMKQYLTRFYLLFANAMERSGNYQKMAQVLDEAISRKFFENKDAFRFFIRSALALERAGDSKAALEKLHKIIADFGNESYTSKEGTVLPVARYASIMTGEIIRRSGCAAYSEYEAKAVQTKDIAKYPNSTYAAKARVKAIKEAIDAGRMMSAEWELTSLRRLCPQFPQDELTALEQRINQSKNKAATFKNLKPLTPLWKVEHGKQRFIYGEGNYFFVPDNRSLVIINATTGKNVKNKIGFLGVNFSEAEVNLPNRRSKTAVEFAGVKEGYSAHKAGIRDGDILLSFDGAEVNQTYELLQYCMATLPGKVVELNILREGREMAVKCVLGDRTDNKDEIIERLLPTEYISFLGLNGNVAFAELNQMLLQINADTGEIISKKMIESLGNNDQRKYKNIGEHDPLQGSDSGVMVVMTQTNRVAAYNPDAELIWEAQLHGRVVCASEYKDGLAAFLVSGQGVDKDKLLVYDIFTGRLIMSEDTLNLLPVSKVKIDSGMIIVSTPGFFYCYDLLVKKRLWAVKADPVKKLSMEHAKGSGTVIAINRDHVRLTTKNGKEIWRAPIKGEAETVEVAGEKLFVASHDSNARNAGEYKISCYNLKSGNLLWSTTLDGVKPHIAAHDPLKLILPDLNLIAKENKLFIGYNTGSGKVAVLDTDNGRMIGKLELSSVGNYNLFIRSSMTNGVLGVITDTGTVGVTAGGE